MHHAGMEWAVLAETRVLGAGRRGEGDPLSGIRHIYEERGRARCNVHRIGSVNDLMARGVLPFGVDTIARW